MRLLKSENQLFNEAIEYKRLNKNSFQFSKKTGWLNIIHRKSNSIFKFHRKQETKLNENLQWKKLNTYFVSIDNKKSELNDLQAVNSAFLIWLSNF